MQIIRVRNARLKKTITQVFRYRKGKMARKGLLVMPPSFFSNLVKTYLAIGHRYTITMKQLNQCLVQILGIKNCHVRKLDDNSNSPVRIDADGESGVLLIFLKGIPTVLAKSASPPVQTHSDICLPTVALCNFLKELLEGDLLVVYASGFAVIWMAQVSGILVMTVTRVNFLLKLLQAIKRKKTGEALSLPL